MGGASSSIYSENESNVIPAHDASLLELDLGASLLDLNLTKVWKEHLHNVKVS